MGRRLVRLAHDADAMVPLILGIAVSVLGLFDIATPRIVDNSILIILAVLSFALLRDRWIKDSSQREVRKASAETLSRLDAMHIAVNGLATVKTLKGADIDLALENARVYTDHWMFKGGTGTYTRAMTLPLCVEIARRERRSLQVRLEILDPVNVALCERYARYRTSQSPGPDGTGEPWTTVRTQKESFATLLAAAWYQQKFQLLDIAVGLTSTMSAFRFDLSSSRIIITQDDPRFPAMMISSDGPLYQTYATELRVSFAQAKRVPLEEAKVLFAEQPTTAQAREFFTRIKIALPDNYSDRDVQQIIDKAIRAKNPYGRASYELPDQLNALSPAAEADGH